VHQALHFFWARLSRQSQLLNLDEQARSAMIDVAVARAIKEFEVRRPDLFGHTFTELEHSRVAALIDEWLRVDEGRPPFSISSVELRHEAEIADIRLRTQIDRIDRYQAGDAESTGPATGPDKSHVDALIIDYKTGNPNNTRISSWDGERPDDPQLPLYALTADADVGGVLFARVSKGKCGYVGLMRGGSTIPGVTALSAEQWREQLDSWRSALENLSSEYRRGDARVRPKSSRSCDVCDLHSFCRIHEQSTDAERP
jgi:RecB family exonuclease